MIKVTGIIKYQDIAVGVWTLISDSGETYELYKPSENLRQDGLNVTVQGKIREDIMSMAMVGKILEIIALLD
jgi:D-arabinose 5-phosphate isomerase GutQ